MVGLIFGEFGEYGNLALFVVVFEKTCQHNCSSLKLSVLFCVFGRRKIYGHFIYGLIIFNS